MKFDSINNPVDSHLTLSIVETIHNKIFVYRLNGKTHRDNGPATIYYDLDGKVIQALWSNHNLLHRLDGAAVQWLDGTIGWWVNGKNVGISSCLSSCCKCIAHTNEEFLRAVKMKAFW